MLLINYVSDLSVSSTSVQSLSSSSEEDEYWKMSIFKQVKIKNNLAEFERSSKLRGSQQILSTNQNFERMNEPDYL